MVGRAAYHKYGQYSVYRSYFLVFLFSENIIAQMTGFI